MYLLGRRPAKIKRLKHHSDDSTPFVSAPATITNLANTNLFWRCRLFFLFFLFYYYYFFLLYKKLKIIIKNNNTCCGVLDTHSKNNIMRDGCNNTYATYLGLAKADPTC